MSLKQKTLKALNWTFGVQLLRQASQFIITAILARLLAPEDFGLVGMATVFTGFVSMLNEAGVSGAIIQKQDITDDHLSSVFWINIAVGIFCAAVFCLGAPLIAAFYSKPELVIILQVSSVNFILASFSIVNRAVLQKEIEFKKLSLIEALSIVVGGASGIVSAIYGAGAFSLVYQLIAFTVINTLLTWMHSSWRPHFRMSKKAITDILDVSLSITGTNVMVYFARNIDYLLIGRFLGVEALGFYTLAYKLMIYPLQNITWTLQKVMFPAFAKIQNDLKKIGQSYQTMIKVISFVTFPMMFGLFGLTWEFIGLVYGPKWLHAVPVIKIFCICGLLQTVLSTCGTVYQSLGKARLQLKISTAGSLLAMGSIVLGLRWGIVGVSACYTLYTVVWYHVHIATVSSVLKLKFLDIYWIPVKNFIFASSMLLVIYGIKHLMPGVNWLVFGVSLTAALVCYGVTLILFKEISLDRFTQKSQKQI